MKFILCTHSYCLMLCFSVFVCFLLLIRTRISENSVHRIFDTIIIYHPLLRQQESHDGEKNLPLHTTPNKIQSASSWLQIGHWLSDVCSEAFHLHQSDETLDLKKTAVHEDLTMASATNAGSGQHFTDEHSNWPIMNVSLLNLLPGNCWTNMFCWTYYFCLKSTSEKLLNKSRTHNRRSSNHRIAATILSRHMVCPTMPSVRRGPNGMDISWSTLKDQSHKYTFSDWWFQPLWKY